MKASLCYVDAYAPDAPDGPAYVVSWVSNCDEHHLLPCATAAGLGSRCSNSVQAKLTGAVGFRPCRIWTAADGLARPCAVPSDPVERG